MAFPEIPLIQPWVALLVSCLFTSTSSADLWPHKPPLFLEFLAQLYKVLNQSLKFWFPLLLLQGREASINVDILGKPLVWIPLPRGWRCLPNPGLRRRAKGYLGKEDPAREPGVHFSSPKLFQGDGKLGTSGMFSHGHFLPFTGNFLATEITATSEILPVPPRQGGGRGGWKSSGLFGSCGEEGPRIVWSHFFPFSWL